MPEWLSSVSAFSVFVSIAALGFVFLLITLVFGEIFDSFGDHDFSDALDHGPSFFSPRVLSVFITAFGGTGAVAVHYGARTVTASLAGFASGFVFAGLIYLFARMLYGQQASTDLKLADLLGTTGRVVVAIPAGGVGQVRCRIGEQVFDQVARSRSGEAIAQNIVVRVDEVLGEIILVSPQ